MFLLFFSSMYVVQCGFLFLPAFFQCQNFSLLCLSAILISGVLRCLLLCQGFTLRLQFFIAHWCIMVHIFCIISAAFSQERFASLYLYSSSSTATSLDYVCLSTLSQYTVFLTVDYFVYS